jgi:uncharacterized repeat protein (TIGR03847 family)
VSNNVWDFPSPNRCVIGTVGQPGERAFYLQVSQDHRLATLAIEKMQAALLVDRLDELLTQVGALGHPVAAETMDNEPLITPIVEDFALSAMSLSWDSDSQCVILECETRSDESVLPVDNVVIVRAVLTASAASEFIRRTRSVLAAGRPPCPLCSMPLEPSGHICPRANGYRRQL